MRHSDIRTTMNIYGDVVTGDFGDGAGALQGCGVGIEPTRLTDCASDAGGVSH